MIGLFYNLHKTIALPAWCHYVS